MINNNCYFENLFKIKLQKKNVLNLNLMIFYEDGLDDIWYVCEILSASTLFL